MMNVVLVACIWVACEGRALLSPALRALSPGAVRPEGWLLAEATLQAKGLSGAHLRAGSLDGLEERAPSG